MCQNRDFPRLQNAFLGFGHVVPHSLMNDHQSAVGKKLFIYVIGTQKIRKLMFYHVLGNTVFVYRSPESAVLAEFSYLFGSIL